MEIRFTLVHPPLGLVYLLWCSLPSLRQWRAREYILHLYSRRSIHYHYLHCYCPESLTDSRTPTICCERKIIMSAPSIVISLKNISIAYDHKESSQIICDCIILCVRCSSKKYFQITSHQKHRVMTESRIHQTFRTITVQIMIVTSTISHLAYPICHHAQLINYLYLIL